MIPKFRAFDPDAEIFVYSDKQYDDYFFEFQDGVLKAFVIFEAPPTLHEPAQPDSAELEDVVMSTGKSDKNDVELYSGDIAESSANNNTYILKYGDYKCELADDEQTTHCGFYWEDKGGFTEGLSKEDSIWMTKIGTIHDKPLEEK